MSKDSSVSERGKSVCALEWVREKEKVEREREKEERERMKWWSCVTQHVIPFCGKNDLLISLERARSSDLRGIDCDDGTAKNKSNVYWQVALSVALALS